MTDRRFRLGVWLSIGWVACIALLLILKMDAALAMKPNEWGDFLAGTSAPLAFLWLVLGYLQQGEELRLNTQALELQVQELKQSVAQQQELVAVTREEMLLSKHSYEREHEQAIRQAQPIFQFKTRSQTGSSQSQFGFELRLSFKNIGHTVTRIKIEPSLGMGQVKPDEFSVMGV